MAYRREFLSGVERDENLVHVDLVGGYAQIQVEPALAGDKKPLEAGKMAGGGDVRHPGFER